MLTHFLFMLLLPICLTQSSSKFSEYIQTENYSKKDLDFKIDCRKTPYLIINALAKSPENTLFTFFNNTYVAISEIQEDNNLVVKKIVESKTLLPKLNGHIESAFTYENITYFLNNDTEMWDYNYKSKILDGPYDRHNKFGCLNNSYDIDSILTIQRSKTSAHMLIYHTENGHKFLTFCHIITEKVVEKYQRPYGTDAIEVVWKDYDTFEGVTTNGHFFGYFAITTFLGNLRYVPLHQPYSDNQLLLDCPQEFCINAKIDAMATTTSGQIYLFRGKYFWHFPTNDIRSLQFDYDSAKLISDYWPELPPNIDSAFCDSHSIYFFKNEKLWKYEIGDNTTKQPLIISDIESEFPKIPSKIDAIWHNKKDQQIYFIKAHNYFVYETRTKVIVEKGEVIPILNNQNQFPKPFKINAIHEDNYGNIYLFSNNYYFLANLTALRSRHTLVASLSQEYLFSCLKSYNYSAVSFFEDFNGFKHSLLEYKPLNISFMPFVVYETATNIIAIEISTHIIPNNALELENNRDLITKWNQSVFSVGTSEENIPVWLMVFIAFTFVFITIISILALFIVLSEVDCSYVLPSNKS